MTFSTKQMIDRFAGPSFHDGNRLAMRERGGPVKAGPFLAKASNGLRAREDQRPLVAAAASRRVASWLSIICRRASRAARSRAAFGVPLSEACYQITLPLYAFLLRSTAFATK